MWTKIVPLTLAALVGGCATNSTILNPAGVPVKFSNPYWTKLNDRRRSSYCWRREPLMVARWCPQKWCMRSNSRGAGFPIS